MKTISGTIDPRIRQPKEWSKIARCNAMQNPVEKNSQSEQDMLRDPPPEHRTRGRIAVVRISHGQQH
jgi:hypothetical protein